MNFRPNISFVTLGVHNLPRATGFYEALGLQRHPRSNPHITFFDMSGQLLGLFSHDALAEDACVPAGAGMTTTLAQNVNTPSAVGTLLDAAVAAGGTLLRAPSEPPWGGLRGYFADPDGHVWEVAYNPGITIDENGRAHLPA